MSTKHTSECLKKAGDDEPIFVLRAKDPTAPVMVRMWADDNEGIQPEEKLAEARKLADEMGDYRKHHTSEDGDWIDYVPPLVSDRDKIAFFKEGLGQRLSDEEIKELDEKNRNSQADETLAKIIKRQLKRDAQWDKVMKVILLALFVFGEAAYSIYMYGFLMLKAIHWFFEPIFKTPMPLRLGEACLIMFVIQFTLGIKDHKNKNQKKLINKKLKFSEKHYVKAVISTLLKPLFVWLILYIVYLAWM